MPSHVADADRHDGPGNDRAAHRGHAHEVHDHADQTAPQKRWGLRRKRNGDDDRGHHGHSHSHGPSISAGAMQRSRLLVVLGITGTVLVVELIGAWLTGSLALLADAGHMATDVTGILLAVLAVTFAAKPATAKRTYGYYRLEIFAAVINAVLLFSVGMYILFEAYRRWDSPPEVESGLMLVFAGIGLAANLIGLAILHRGAQESLNVKGAYLEVLGDALGSVAVIVAALVIALTGWARADVVASVAVALLILPRTWTLLREAVDVLLQATPRNVDPQEIRQHIGDVPGVVDAHDLHVWTLTSGIPVLSVHVVVEDAVFADNRGGKVLDQLGECLQEHFDIGHSTFQLEPRSHAAHEANLHA